MPQLMPLFWVVSFMMIMLLMLVALKIYFNSVEELSNDNMMEVMIKNWLW